MRFCLPHRDKGLTPTKRLPISWRSKGSYYPGLQTAQPSHFVPDHYSINEKKTPRLINHGSETWSGKDELTPRSSQRVGALKCMPLMVLGVVLHILDQFSPLWRPQRLASQRYSEFNQEISFTYLRYSTDVTYAYTGFISHTALVIKVKVRRGVFYEWGGTHLVTWVSPIRLTKRFTEIDHPMPVHLSILIEEKKINDP